MNYFPTHLALGDAFCNRKEELSRLLADIEGNSPALILATRRYGKTSLVIRTLEKAKLPYVHIDLYKELTEDDIEQAVLQGVGVLIGQLETKPKRLLSMANEFFSGMKIKVVYEKSGLSLDFSMKEKKPAHNILEALNKLHDLAKSKKRKVVMYMDEFQVLAEITKDHSIEAAIREAAQKSTHVQYIFSGSNRHLIEAMFYDKKRPFYKICDVIILGKISEKDYIPYIQKAAKEKWGKPIEDDVISRIFSISERHPYYLNKLCGLVWMKNWPSEGDVISCWHDFVLESKPIIERELGLLTVNQRKLLIAIAREGKAVDLLGKAFTAQHDFALSSMSQTIKALTEKDYILKDESEAYIIIDPLIKDVLRFKTESKAKKD